MSSRSSRRMCEIPPTRKWICVTMKGSMKVDLEEEIEAVMERLLVVDLSV